MTDATAFPPAGQRVHLPDVDIQVYDAGPDTGQPVVLLHGFLTSAFTWRHVCPELATRHRVIMVDLPGSGRSSDPPPGVWTADRACDQLRDLFDRLELAAPTVVGSQMGGSLAAWFACRHRARVGRLVVMAAGVLGENGTNLGLYRLLARSVIGPMAARVFPRRAFESRWRAAHGPGHVMDEAALAYYMHHFRERGATMARFGLGIRTSYGEAFDALAEPIRGLDVPTLLLFGEDDPLVPVSTGRRFADLLADARLTVLPGCGDFPQEERPRQVAEAIEEFLALDRPFPRPA